MEPVQKIKLNPVIEVEIPLHLVLVSTVELQQLKDKALKLDEQSPWGTMKWLEDQTDRRNNWLKANILYPWKDSLERIGCVHYPNNKGDKWTFEKSLMLTFLKENFAEILN